MYVVGATRADFLKEIRVVVPEHFLLIPGIGAQGGDLESVVRNGINQSVGLIVNSSRSIIYASSGKDFAEAARRKTIEFKNEMERLMDKYL
jgi:orotidine-5'-phosphate decarboxylase